MDFKQNHMEVGNITKAATFKNFLHVNNKNNYLFCDSDF